MGKAIFKDTGVRPNLKDQISGKIRFQKSRNSLKINLMLTITILNLVLSIYTFLSVSRILHGN